MKRFVLALALLAGCNCKAMPADVIGYAREFFAAVAPVAHVACGTLFKETCTAHCLVRMVDGRVIGASCSGHEGHGCQMEAVSPPPAVPANAEKQ